MLRARPHELRRGDRGAIDAAQHEIRVQAYWLTPVPTLRALAAAEHRCQAAAAILDKSQDHGELAPIFPGGVGQPQGGINAALREPGY
jgi:phosphatidylserine/phosphatidylglycerophosphate/cardiolipin synthase-like enzyme